MTTKTPIRSVLVAAVVWSSGAALGAGIAIDTGGTPEMIVDFRTATDSWRNIDDVVMGGLSSSEMVIEDGVAVFRGDVSLDNNGGFASVPFLYFIPRPCLGFWRVSQRIAEKA